MARILVVEDEQVIRGGVRDALMFKNHEVVEAATGAAGLDLGRHKSFDLILLDVMLPEVDGFTVCETLRREKNYTPIIMMTAKGKEEDVVEGLQRGADDYVTKPFGIKELMARVEAALRRGAPRQDYTETVRFDGVTVNFSRMEIERGGEIIPLTGREADLIRYFMNNSGKVVTREELLLRVWEYGTADLETRTVDIHMAKLRKKLEADAANPRILETVRGQGYKFMPEAVRA